MNHLQRIPLASVRTLSVAGLLALMAAPVTGQGQAVPPRGELLYQNNLAEASDVKDWIMEGDARTEFRDGWMEMYSPDEASHHVFWCPEDFPGSFIAEWEAQNLDPTYGLCIIFFAAKGVEGQDIFDPSLPARDDGEFKWYIKDQLRSYHISYYANTPKKPGRGSANLRKNNDFVLVQEGKVGIPAHSTEIHRLKLVKDGPHIMMFVDDRKIIDWMDTPDNEPRDVYEGGKIGFRQMQWTHFRYRNFRVWAVDSVEERLQKMEDLEVIHPKRRVWASPARNEVAMQNPPTLIWPLGKGNYAVRLSQDESFKEYGTIEACDIPWAMYNPHETLAPGMWYWQYLDGEGEWSDVEQFLITGDSTPWSPPSPETLVDSVPDYHPRVLVDLPELNDFRAKARNTREAERILATAESMIGQKPPSEKDDILSIEGDSPAKTDKLRKDASKEMGQDLYKGVRPLVQAYVLTGNPRYSDQAKEWALEAAMWDPDGVTRINDFGDSRIMLSMALVYDTLYNELTPDERSRLLEATVARGRNFYEDYVNNKEGALLSNHVWQHILHYFFDTSVALVGDHPEAELWLSYLYELFLARAPVLGGPDGGWTEGLSYFRMNMETLVDVPQRIKDYTGFDFMKHSPWHAANPYFFLYGFPPGSAGTGFADNSHDLPEPRGDYLAYADALSRLLQNPYAAWYRDRVMQVMTEVNPHLQDYWREDYVAKGPVQRRLEDASLLQWQRLKYLNAIPAAKPKSPADLPMARVFPDIGEVMMHSQSLAEPATNNLFVAMRSGTFGSYGHMLSDSNTFNMVYGGDRLFYHAGYKVAMKAPHRLEYYAHTQSHNGILVGGEGQPYHTEAYGWIENFLDGERLSYAVGNASNAYDSPTEDFDAGLETFRRHIVMLRPDIFVIYDELEANEAKEWTYLLHSYEEITIDPKDQIISTHNQAGRAMVHLLSSGEAEWSVTDEYPILPDNWRGVKDEEGNLKEYTNNAWHFSATTERQPGMRFLAIYQVRPNGQTDDADFNQLLKVKDGVCRVGEWKIEAAMNPEEPAVLRITNMIDGVAFASSGAIKAPGLVLEKGSPAAAKLAEKVDGQWVLKESPPQIPAAAETAIKAFAAQTKAETR